MLQGGKLARLGAAIPPGCFPDTAGPKKKYPARGGVFLKGQEKGH